ncbi:MAG: RsmE family RNA methyltransferase [Anaerolineae bacterium]
MTQHRFFIPPEWIREQSVTLFGEIAHQVCSVLRLRPGDHIIVLDNTGWECEVELQRVSPGDVIGRVVEERPATGEPRTRIILYQAALRARRFEFVLQKGTELGIAEFVPVVCERSLVADVSDLDAKRERWQHIIREAAEQSHRGRLPALRTAMMFALACQEAVTANTCAFILSEHEEHFNLKQALAHVKDNERKPPVTFSLFVGPEGGFTMDEIYLAAQYGIQPVGLGPRVLRAETAGLVAASAILYEMES